MAKTKPTTKPAKAGRWWVIQRHDEFSVEEHSEYPNPEHKAGERIPAVHGPYANREEANQVKDTVYARTLKGMTERAGL